MPLRIPSLSLQSRARESGGGWRHGWAVVFHNHPHFLSKALEAAREGGFDLARTAVFDLGRFARAMSGAADRGSGTTAGEGPRPLKLEDIERADTVIAGIDPRGDLPPFWWYMIATWVEKRLTPRGCLVWLDDAGNDVGSAILRRFLRFPAQTSMLDEAEEAWEVDPQPPVSVAGMASAGSVAMQTRDNGG